MNQQLKSTTADLVAALLIHYSFDLGGNSASDLVKHWLDDYPEVWVRYAVIEALYRGRYKAVSVDQILAIWQRRGTAIYNFNHEFERLVCGLPQTFAELTDVADAPHAHQPLRVIIEAGAAANPPVTIHHLPQDEQNGKLPKRHAAKSQLDCNRNHSPIKQFTPSATQKCDLYTKLRAIAQDEDNPPAAD